MLKPSNGCIYMPQEGHVQLSHNTCTVCIMESARHDDVDHFLLSGLWKALKNSTGLGESLKLISMTRRRCIVNHNMRGTHASNSQSPDFENLQVAVLCLKFVNSSMGIPRFSGMPNSQEGSSFWETVMTFAQRSRCFASHWLQYKPTGSDLKTRTQLRTCSNRRQFAQDDTYRHKTHPCEHKTIGSEEGP